MKSITNILTAIAFFVAGCSADRCYWYQPGKTLKQARQDCRDCYREALNDELKVGVECESSRHLSAYDRDPEYRPDFDDVITLHEFNLQNATRGCMKRKGYHLTRARELGSEVRRKTTCIFGECFPVAGR